MTRYWFVPWAYTISLCYLSILYIASNTFLNLSEPKFPWGSNGDPNNKPLTPTGSCIRQGPVATALREAASISGGRASCPLYKKFHFLLILQTGFSLEVLSFIFSSHRMWFLKVRWFNLLKHLYKQSQLGRNNTQGVKKQQPSICSSGEHSGGNCPPFVIKGHNEFKLSSLCVTFPPPTLTWQKSWKENIRKKKKDICFGVTPDSSLPGSVALDSSLPLAEPVSSCVDPLSHRVTMRKKQVKFLGSTWQGEDAQRHGFPTVH